MPGRKPLLETAGIVWAASVAATALAVNIAPFASGDLAKPANEQEQRVWSQSRELDEIVVKSALLYSDPALTAYVQGVGEHLFPEFRGVLTIRILKAPHLNAFAVANGSIYMNLGLLARFQNEAQLATVLAHEGTHFTARHSYRNQQNVKDSAAFAAIGGMLGVPILPELLAASSIFGYSRELENEADLGAFRRLAQAGYDVRESPRTFEHLMKEVQAEGIREPFFFSTHPKLKDRFEYLTKLAAQAPPGGSGTSRAEYARVVQKARVDNLADQLSSGRVKHALLMLEDRELMQELPPYGEFFVGEAYRLRGDKGDLERAEAAYRKAIAADPSFAPSYRALGTLLLKAKKYSEAEANLQRYLEIAPNAVDRKFAESYLQMIKKREGQP